MDVEKTMEFILEQNAATAVGLERLKERLDELTAIANKHGEQLQMHTEWLNALTRGQTQLMKVVMTMGERMEAGFAEVRESQKATHDNLNILIRTVQDMLQRPPQQ